MKQILINFLVFLIVISGSIFVVGTFEVTRNQFMYDIVENNVMMENSTPGEIYNQYLAFKDNDLFKNTYFVLVLNFFGILGLFYIFYDAAKEGWSSRPLNFNQVFINYGLLWILVFYILLILFNYFKDLFVNQVLVLLFNDLLNDVFIFNFFINYFIGLFFIAVLIGFFANQIRHFKTIDV